MVAPLQSRKCNPSVAEVKILVMNRRTIVGIIFIVAALLKLAHMWNIINLEWLWQKPWPEYFAVFFLLFIGAELIIYSYRSNPGQWLQRPLPVGEEGKRLHCSVRYGADQYVYQGEPFSGARLDAFCGGLRFDLRKAVISDDEEIDIHTYLGGVEIYIPNDVNVVVKSRSFLGGVSDGTSKQSIPNAHTLHIVASNMLGGVNIKRSTND